MLFDIALEDCLTGAKLALPLLAGVLFADVGFAVLVDRGFALGTGANRILSAEVDFLLIIIVAVVLAILGFVGLRMAMRDDEDEDAETFEDEEWQPKQKKAIRTQPDMEDMPTGRSLDELTTKGSAVSMTKSKRVDRRACQRPAPVEEVLDENTRSEEWDYTQDEDYHVDDDGVEWWKDEIGQWWYKYPEDEDWEAFNE